MREINFLTYREDPGPACSLNPDAEGHCITCSDEAKTAEVLWIDPATETALVRLDGEESEVDISLLEDVSPGDILLIHGGVALNNQAARS